MSSLTPEQKEMVRYMIFTKPAYVTQVYMNAEMDSRLQEKLETKQINRIDWIKSLLTLYYFHDDFRDYIDVVRRRIMAGTEGIELRDFLLSSKHGSTHRLQFRVHENLYMEAMIMAKRRKMSISEFARVVIGLYCLSHDFEVMVDDYLKTRMNGLIAVSKLLTPEDRAKNIVSDDVYSAIERIYETMKFPSPAEPESKP